jgi:hypothetical protein
VRTMNSAMTSGTPPSVEGIVSRPSPFAVEETLEGLQEVICRRNLTLFAHFACGAHLTRFPDPGAMISLHEPRR